MNPYTALKYQILASLKFKWICIQH